MTLPAFGSDEDFAALTGMNPKHLSQIKTGRRNVGDITMGKIEEALGLPTGAWDIPIEGPDEEDSSSQARKMRAGLLMQVSRLPEEEVEKAFQTMQFVLGLGGPKKTNTEG